MAILKSPQNYCVGRCAASHRGNHSPRGAAKMHTRAKRLKKTVNVSSRITKTMVFRKRESAVRESPSPRNRHVDGFPGRLSRSRDCLSLFLWKRALFTVSNPSQRPTPFSKLRKSAVEIPLFPPNKSKAAPFPSRRLTSYGDRGWRAFNQRLLNSITPPPTP